MGMWDFEAWDNDTAADWFGNFMSKTELRKHWLEAIQGDTEDEPEATRAAVWLFAQLGRVYVWPIENFDADCHFAIQAAEAIIGNHDFAEEVPEYIEKVKQDLAVIQARHSNG